MKVKLTTVTDVQEFCRAASALESDVFVSIGRYTVDGKSILGLFSLNLINTLDVSVVEKNLGETEVFKAELAKLGVLV